MSFRSLRSITPRGLGLNHCSIKSGVLYNTKQQCVNISHNMFLISLGFSYPICFISRLTGESKPAGIEIVWQRTLGSMFEHLWNNTSKKPGWMMIFLWWCRKSIPTLIIPGCFSPWTLAPKRSIWFWRISTIYCLSIMKALCPNGCHMGILPTKSVQYFRRSMHPAR